MRRTSRILLDGFREALWDRVRAGEITSSVRIRMQPRVKVGGRYPLFPGLIVVESSEEIGMEEITDQMAEEGGLCVRWGPHGDREARTWRAGVSRAVSLRGLVPSGNNNGSDPNDVSCLTAPANDYPPPLTNGFGLSSIFLTDWR